ncbi:MAG: PilZ domain-containing protein [Gammaproteobacteria bacterium]|nr:PilZ domain-containing protein [Gammaproteobacteria bacterium]MDJ0890915.1 PilZ domain-containing protein [Gammaproteobacteria bacterium]
MPSQPAQDRRQHPRRDASLVVTFRPELPTAAYDITHTRNVSQGGMMLTTASAYARGTRLAIQVPLSFRNALTLMQGTAEVLAYRELVPNLLSETRLRFVAFDRQSAEVIASFAAMSQALHDGQTVRAQQKKPTETAQSRRIPGVLMASHGSVTS